MHVLARAALGGFGSRRIQHGDIPQLGEFGRARTQAIGRLTAHSDRARGRCDLAVTSQSLEKGRRLRARPAVEIGKLVFEWRVHL